jgi:uncharacterized protein YxeA
MEQNNKSSSRVGLIIAAVVVVLGIGLAVYALNNNSNKNSDNVQTKSTSSSKTSNTSDTTKKAVVGSTVITFTDKGFDKSTYTSKAGESVTVKNASSNDLQFSSGPHPTHTDHPELNMSVMGPGESGTFTPAGKGTYSFHDHIDEQFTGTLIVE